MGDKHKDKEASLVKQMEAVRLAILETAGGLLPEQQEQVFLGEWSPADLIAHLIGWDHTNLVAIRSILAGELPAFYAHHDKDWKTYNAHLVAQYKRDDFAELLAEARKSQSMLLAELDALPPEALEKDFGVRSRGYKVTIGRLMRVELADEKEHLAQLQRL